MPEQPQAINASPLQSDPALWSEAAFPPAPRKGPSPHWWLIALMWIGALTFGPGALAWSAYHPKDGKREKISIGGLVGSMVFAGIALAHSRTAMKRQAWRSGRIEPASLFEGSGGSADGQLLQMAAQMAGGLAANLAVQQFADGAPSSARFLSGTAFPMLRINDGRILRGKLRVSLSPQHQIARSDVIWVVKATRLGPWYALADVAPREFLQLKVQDDLARAFKFRLRSIQAPRENGDAATDQPQSAGPRMPKPRKPAG
ncbi:MAG: hypothetical protein IT463_11985 [Planctomycetes bacterium]|nr:hypothetical protein [Planctomycetota bacterium]